MQGTVLLCHLCFICVYFCDFYSDGIPMVTYTRQELFACNNAAVSGSKLPQPLFDAIKDNGICAVTRGCRVGLNCNRQRTIRPVIGRRPGFKPLFHQRGVNNNNNIHVKLSTCQIVGNDCYTNMALKNARSVKKQDTCYKRGDYPARLGYFGNQRAVAKTNRKRSDRD